MTRALAAFALAVALGLGAPAGAEEHAARLDPARTIAADTGRGLTVELALGRAVPWRVRHLDGPPRLALDLRGLEGPLDPQPLVAARAVEGARLTQAPGGWTRLELDLARPLAVESAGMEVLGEGALVRVRLGPVEAARFAEIAAAEDPRPEPIAATQDAPAGDEGPLVVMIDPGHGGRDPGAMAGGIRESELVLDFARVLKEALLRSGRFEVVLTREDDAFVPLEERVRATLDAGADVFVSLHADALEAGAASGASVYHLGPEDEAKANARLVERHEGTQVMQGLDLSGQGDGLALALAEIVRRDTAPRSRRLAEALAAQIEEGTGRIYKRPVQTADFSVLKSADVPSVLVELGFLSSEGDADLLTDPAYRRRLAFAIRDGLVAWAVEDAARAGLTRR